MDGVDIAAADDQFTLTLARGLQILLAFSSEKPKLTNHELVALTGLNKATVSRLAFTLIELGYLRREGLRGGYALDTAVLTLGYPMLASLQIRQVARPWMRELAARVGATVSICVRDRDSIAYLDSVRKIDRSTPLVDIGSTLPLVATAGGRAWLAAVPAAERNAVLNQLRLRNPAVLESNLKEIEKARAHLQRYGFCINRGIHDPRRVAVAVPMCKPLNGELMVFSCTLLTEESQRLALARTVGYELTGMVRSIETATGIRGVSDA